VAQVCVAPAAEYLWADREGDTVGLPADVLLGDGGVETGPSGPRIEFRVREEETVPATDAPVDSLSAGIDVLRPDWI